MSSETGLITLLCERWEAARRRGEEIAAEDLCRDHPELLEELRRAIRHLAAAAPLADESTDPFSRAGAPGSGPQMTVADGRGGSVDAPGSDPALIAGRYRLLSRLGEGGMGTVWRAEQVLPIRRAVALKLIKAGTDSAQVVARFETERQALALMDHPHIAKVLDAGTTEQGQPFFVMELVDGPPLTAFCDAHQLTLRQRLELFVRVCQAVQHAHQKGVIHRDLKPSNVLVTEVDGKPCPKVIDFGLAKALQVGAIPNAGADSVAGSVLGTPLYMAPEQAGFGSTDVDTRADVYALGGILYELLTGSTPIAQETLRRAALAEVLRLIRESEPPAPGARLEDTETLSAVAAARRTNPDRLKRLVRGELEWVTMKCLEKDRERRYSSASALASDVLRYLAAEPVSVGPPGRWYRARKFVFRNRGLVLAAALVWGALVVGVIGTTWGMVRATDARSVAEDKERDATRAAEEEGRARAREAEQRGLAETNAGLAKQAQTAAEKSAAEARQQAEIAQRAAFSLQLSRASGLAVAQPQTAAAFLHDERLAQKARREFGWGVLDRMTDIGRVLAGGHTSPIEALAFSPDGKWLATGGWFDGTVCLWDVATWKRVAKWDGYKGAITGLVFSPDGTELAVAGGKAWRSESVVFPIGGKGQPEHKMSAGKTPPTAVRILGVPSGRLRAELTGNRNGVLCVAWSKHGLVATGGEDGWVRIWDAATGALVAETRAHGAPVNVIAFTTGGRRLVTGGEDRKVRVWLVGGGLGAHLSCLAGAGSPLAGVVGVSQLAGITELEQARSTLSVPTVLMSIATPGDIDGFLSGDASGSVRLTENRSGGEVANIDSMGSMVYGTGSSPSFRTVAFCTETQLRVRTADGKRIELTKTRSKLAVHPTRPLIATGSDDGEVVIWDLSATTPNGRMAYQRYVTYNAFALSPDQKLLALTSGNIDEIELRDPLTMDVVRSSPRLPAGVEALRFSGNGETLFTIERAITDPKFNISRAVLCGAWDVRTMTERYQVRCPEGYWQGLDVQSAGGTVALGGSDGVVSLYSGADGQFVRKLDRLGGDGARHVAFSPDGKWLAAGTYAATAKGQPPQAGAAVVWDTTTWERHELALPGMTGGVTHLGWAPKGPRLLVAWFPPTKKADTAPPACWGVWDAGAKKWAVLSPDTKQSVKAFAFSADGAALLVGRDDRRVERIDLATGTSDWVGPKFGSDIDRIAWSPDGRSIAVTTAGANTAGGDTLYTLDPVLGLEQLRLVLDNNEGCQFLQFLAGSDVLVAGRKWRLHTWDARPRPEPPR